MFTKKTSCPHGTFGKGIGATEPSISTRPAGTSTSLVPRWTGWWFPGLEDWTHTKYNKTLRWWFQLFLIFTPIWGRFPFWRSYFSDGWLKPPTRTALDSSAIYQLNLPSSKERVNPGWYGKLHPRKLTWNLKITCLKRKIIFQTSIVGFHVSFWGCIPSMSTITYSTNLPFEAALWNEGSWWVS